MRHFKSLATNEAKTPPNHGIAKDFTKSLKIDTTHVPKFSYKGQLPVKPQTNITKSFLKS